MTSPVLQHHWTQQQAATATGRSRRTIQSWCLPMPWRDAILAPDPAVSAQHGRPMYRIADVVEAERLSRSGRDKRRRNAA